MHVFPRWSTRPHPQSALIGSNWHSFRKKGMRTISWTKEPKRPARAASWPDGNITLSCRLVREAAGEPVLPVQRMCSGSAMRTGGEPAPVPADGGKNSTDLEEALAGGVVRWPFLDIGLAIPAASPPPSPGSVVPAAVGCSAKPPPMAATAPCVSESLALLEGDVPQENATTSPSWRSTAGLVNLARVVGQPEP